MKRRKDKPMAQAQAADFGPEDRYRHGCVVAEGRAGEALDPDGNRVIRARETHECLLDALYERGALGTEDAAERRYSAGLWLRRCYMRAGLNPRVTGVLEGALGKRHMSDAEGWNFKCFNEAMREMKRFALTVRSVVIGDEANNSQDALVRGLDLLAKHRGIE